MKLCTEGVREVVCMIPRYFDPIRRSRNYARADGAVNEITAVLGVVLNDFAQRSVKTH